MGETLRLLKEKEQDPADLSFSAAHLARLVDLADEGAVNNTVAKEVFEQIFLHDVDPDQYIEEHGLKTISDTGLLTQVITQAMADHPQSVTDYRNGKKKAMGYLVGQVMKAMKANSSVLPTIHLSMMSISTLPSVSPRNFSSFALASARAALNDSRVLRRSVTACIPVRVTASKANFNL